MKKKIRLVVVGTGYFSQFHYDAWERLGVKIVGICSLDENEAKKYSHAFDNCKVYLNFEEMIVKALPDIVDIVIPPQNHLKFIKIAAKHSVNVICQKPFTNSLAEAKKAIKTAKNHGIKIAVHENFRYQPWYRKIDDLLKSFLLGDIFQVSFRMRPGDGQGKEAYLNRQPYFQKMERFLIHETAIHFIDVFRFLFGDIKSVFATLSKLNKNITGEDAGMVFIDFKSGVKGLFDGNRLSDHIAKDRRLTIGEMLIEGSKGTIRLNGDGEIFFRKFNKNNEKLIKYKWSSKGFAGDSVFYYQKHVIDHFIKGEHLINNAEDYIVNIKIEESIYKSNKYKKLIDIT
jgi:predicted dehydrogenase